MGLYSYRASKKLTDLLDRAREGGDPERLSLAEEVDVARTLCERAIRLFDGACLGEQADKVSTSLKHASIKNVQESLKVVADLVQAYAKMMLVSDDVFNATQVEYLMKGITEVLAEVLEDEPSKVEAILEGLGKLFSADKKASRQVSITIG